MDAPDVDASASDGTAAPRRWSAAPSSFGTGRSGGSVETSVAIPPILSVISRLALPSIISPLASRRPPSLGSHSRRSFHRSPRAGRRRSARTPVDHFTARLAPAAVARLALPSIISPLASRRPPSLGSHSRRSFHRSPRAGRRRSARTPVDHFTARLAPAAVARLALPSIISPLASRRPPSLGSHSRRSFHRSPRAGRRRSARTPVDHFTARLAPAAVARLALPSIISPLASRRPPSLGSHSRRSFHRSPRAGRRRSARTPVDHFTARLAPAAVARLALPSIISPLASRRPPSLGSHSRRSFHRSPRAGRRRSARTPVDHFTARLAPAAVARLALPSIISPLASRRPPSLGSHSRRSFHRSPRAGRRR